MRAFVNTQSRLTSIMVQLKIQTNFVRFKCDISAPSMSDCLLDPSNLFSNGLAIKGTAKCVSWKFVQFKWKHTRRHMVRSIVVQLLFLNLVQSKIRIASDNLTIKKQTFSSKTIKKFSGNWISLFAHSSHRKLLKLDLLKCHVPVKCLA